MGRHNQPLDKAIVDKVVAYYTTSSDVSVTQTAREFLLTFGQVKKALVEANVFRAKVIGNYVRRANIRRESKPGKLAAMPFFKEKR